MAAQLLRRGERVLGLDNLNAYYNPALKQARLARLAKLAAQLDRPEAWNFLRLDLADGLAMAQLFEREQPQAVVHLAAQAGVRHSLENPAVYIQSNLVGFGHLLEGCRQQRVAHLV